MIAEATVGEYHWNRVNDPKTATLHGFKIVLARKRSHGEYYIALEWPSWKERKADFETQWTLRGECPTRFRYSGGSFIIRVRKL